MQVFDKLLRSLTPADRLIAGDSGAGYLITSSRAASDGVATYIQKHRNMCGNVEVCVLCPLAVITKLPPVTAASVNSKHALDVLDAAVALH